MHDIFLLLCSHWFALLLKRTIVKRIFFKTWNKFYRVGIIVGTCWDDTLILLSVSHKIRRSEPPVVIMVQRYLTNLEMSNLHRTGYESTIYRNPKNLTIEILKWCYTIFEDSITNLKKIILHLHLTKKKNKKAFRKYKYIIKKIEYWLSILLRKTFVWDFIFSIHRSKSKHKNMARALLTYQIIDPTWILTTDISIMVASDHYVICCHFF